MRLLILLSLTFSITTFAKKQAFDFQGCFERMRQYCEKAKMKSCSYEVFRKDQRMIKEVGQGCLMALKEQDDFSRYSPVANCMQQIETTGCKEIMNLSNVPANIMNNSNEMEKLLASKQVQFENCLKSKASMLTKSCRRELIED